MVKRNKRYIELDVPFYITKSENLDKFLEKINNKPQSYTFYLDDVEHFNETINTIVNSVNFRDAFYVVFIFNEDQIMGVQMIADIMWEYRLLKTKIIVLNSNQDIFKIYNITINDCGSTSNASLIYEYSPNQNCSVDTFSSKINIKEVFKNCPLHITWSALPPFVNLPKDPRGGLFLDMLDPFGAISGRLVTYRPYNPTYLEELRFMYYGSVQEDLENEYADIFVGPTDLALMELFDLLPIITSDSLVIIVPTPVDNYWDTIKKLAGFDRVLLYFGALGAMTFTFYLLVRSIEPEFGSFAQVVFMFLGTYLNVDSFVKWPKNNYLRCFLAMCLLGTIIIIVYTQACVFGILFESVYGKPITNMEDYLKTDIPLKLINGTDALFQSFGSKEYKEMYNRRQLLIEFSNLEDAADHAVAQRNFATMTDMAYTLTKPNFNKAFGHFEVWNMRLCFAVKKNQYYFQQFNDWFSIIIESGYYEKYKRLYQAKSAWKNNLELEKQNFVLSLRKFLVAFVSLMIGLFFSSVVFIVELFNYKIFNKYCKSKK
ncbi:uncharacterized protein LOC115876331 [Sitophilus oryzae]|uniref:Uncharacterized protein LOC115876331 n=1 Tax=Sitophilus oryzae TaxID=7048 RepID=A0A6J2X9M8_SITOR|nr:uncharacterized protein LOC115876331 [Sitophilus oryzae]